MTQMIAHYTIADARLFREQFDLDAEDRGLNGLSLLQLWRESDTEFWALFQVADAVRARAWQTGAAVVFHSRARVLASEFHFVETV